MSNKKRIISVLLILVFGIVFMSSGCAKEPAPAPAPDPEEGEQGAEEGVPEIVRWASASLGSSGYAAITNLSAVVGKYEKESRHSSMSTAGSVENCRLIPAGEADLGQTVSSDIINRMNATNQFEGEDPAEIWQIMGYRENVDMFITKANSGIKTAEDLDGKSIGLGPAGGSVALRGLAVLEVLGGDYDVVYGTWAQLHEQVAMGRLDVVFPATVCGASATTATIELATTYDLNIIPIDLETAEKASKLVPGGSVGQIQPELLELFENGADVEVYAPSTFAILGVRPNMSEQAVYNITKTIFENAEEIRENDQALRFVSEENTFKYMSKEIPVHPGAVKYYKEIGIWDDSFNVGELK